MRVLITSGGTREQIDGVRAVVNTSTGALGKHIAEIFAEAGWDVSLVHAADALLPDPGTSRLHTYVSFRDLEHILSNLLEEQYFDVIIHAAAVSDFSPVRISDDSGNITAAGKTGKLSSKSREITVTFKRNPKLIERIRILAPSSLLVAFKLTNKVPSQTRQRIIRDFISRGMSDLLVHNDLSLINASVHHAWIYDAEGHLLSETSTKQELGRKLESICRELKNTHERRRLQ
jgi:phosphopantothenate--cysteine ligase